MKRASALLLLAFWIPLHGQTTSSGQNADESVEFIQHAPRTDAEASAIEESLAANPDDRLAHVHLFGYYWSQATFFKRTDVRHKLVVQADWFAVHEPQSAVFDRSGFALERTDFDPPYVAELPIYKGHWKSAIDRNPNDTKVLLHAFSALHAVDVQVPFICSAQLRTLMPAYPQFAVQLALYLAQFIVNQSRQTAPASAGQEHSAFATVVNSNDSAVIGLTGQLLYGLGRVNGKTEAYLPQAEALLKKAHELDSANQRWIDALQSPPPDSVAAALAVVDTLTQEDLWADGKVPTIDGSSDALLVDAPIQAARMASPTAAFVQNALSSSQLGPGDIKLKALIGEDGKVRAIQFESGSVRHFPTALGMTKDWQYHPTLSNGKPLKVLTTIDLRYAAYVQPLPGAGGVAGMGGDPTDTGSTVTKAIAPGRINVSPGTISGNILSRTNPVYPAVARAARVQGIVVLQATISKAGLVEDLRVISGPPLLQQSALDAVRTWRYKPYMLNGQPVEIGTQVNVVFALQDSPAAAPLANAPPR